MVCSMQRGLRAGLRAGSGALQQLIEKGELNLAEPGSSAPFPGPLSCKLLTGLSYVLHFYAVSPFIAQREASFGDGHAH